MTINSVRYLDTVDSVKCQNEIHEAKLPLRIWHAIEPPFKGKQPAPAEGYKRSTNETVIVIDNGMCNNE